MGASKFINMAIIFRRSSEIYAAKPLWSINFGLRFDILVMIDCLYSTVRKIVTSQVYRFIGLQGTFKSFFSAM
jgi:hypothetical protein